jgi:hypothetical protein
MHDLLAVTHAAARADFLRARRGHFLASVRRRLTRRPAPCRPRDLTDVATLSWHPARLREIPLSAIVGTVEATADFDAHFRPATDRLASRWQKVARAYREGHSLPPIAVIEQPDGYYIIDGRHRVSVARELGQREIDAWASRGHAQPERRPAGRGGL